MRSENVSTAIPDINESLRLLQILPSMDIEERRAIIDRLARNPSPYVRQRALHMGSVLLPEEQMVDYLRNDADDIERNIGLEMLKMRGQKALPLAVSLLKDSDPDIVLQAILILDSMRSPLALEPLRFILHTTDDLNIMQAAIVGIGHIGDERVIPDLERYLDSNPWLQLAAISAMGEIRSLKTVPRLMELLNVPFLETVSAEAMARIGGVDVFTSLAGHWLDHQETLDSEFMLGLLVYVSEGLTAPPPNIEGLSEVVQEKMNSSSRKEGCLSARLLLAMDEVPYVSKAIGVLEKCQDLPGMLPTCLKERYHLLIWLLEAKDPVYSWGLQLASGSVDRIGEMEMSIMLTNPLAPEHMDEIVPLCEQIKDKGVAPLLLRLWINLPSTSRPKLDSALIRHKIPLVAELGRMTGIDPWIKVMLQLVVKEQDVNDTAEILKNIPEEHLAEAVDHLKADGRVLRQLPWKEWLETGRNARIRAAGIAATRGGLKELGPMLRENLKRTGNPDIMRMLGMMGDPQNIEAIESFATCTDPMKRAIALECLGEIGGQYARKAIINSLSLIEEKEKKIAYRSLARCAGSEDREIFGTLCGHKDWIVRLACVEYFERYPDNHSLPIVYSLASDPVQIVACRASSILEKNKGLMT